MEKKPSQATENSCNLGSTVENFANRLARKMREKDAEASVSERAAEKRRTLILAAMANVRKALQETSRIQMGDRFSLNLKTDDWEGWPRVQLALTDKLDPKNSRFTFLILAHDRHDSGSIEFSIQRYNAPGLMLGKVELSRADEFSKLPLLLKRGVREFLELVEQYVLNPQKPEELLEVQARPVEEEDGEADLVNQRLKSADVFSDDSNVDQNLVEAVTELKPLGNVGGL